MVNREEVEGPWKLKCGQFEKIINDLNKEIDRLNQELKRAKEQVKVEEKIIYVEDTQRINHLLADLDRVNKQLLQKNKEIANCKQQMQELEELKDHF